MKTKIIVIVLAAATLAIAAWFVLRPRARGVTVPPAARPGDLLLESAHVKIAGHTCLADTGTLVVPENRTRPDSGLIALPVKRIHATGPNPGEPIFYLAGGPGTSNLGFRPPAWLLAGHDVVLVGYRGVDGTPRLDSPEFARALRRGRGLLLDDPNLDALGQAAAACAARLRSEGTDLSGYTIPEVVEDMEAARQALGYERIHLLSQSYGTRVAQIYAAMHAQSLARSVMIGVNPPGHFLWTPATTDEQVERYGELWREAEGPGAPDIAAIMRRVNAQMPKRWLFLSIDPGKVRCIAFVLLFHRTTAPIVFDAYLAANRGDFSGLALMSAAFGFLMPNMMTWGEFFALGSSDNVAGRDYRAELRAPDPVLGSPLSLLIYGSVVGTWPDHRIDDRYRRVIPTDVETLLVSGSVDFSTPPIYAETELLPSLSRGRHVVISEQGHTGDFWRFQPRAAERLLTSFYQNGTADDSLYVYFPMTFEPAFRFTTIAKAVVVALLVLTLGVGLAVLRIVRGLRRRARQPAAVA